MARWGRWVLGFVAALAAAPAWSQAPAPMGPAAIAGVWISAKFSAVRAGPPVGNPGLRLALDGAPIPLLPWAQAIVDRRLADEKAGKPSASTKARCLPGGTPLSMSPPADHPMEIYESPNEVAILFEEFTTYRLVRMNQPHMADPDPSFFGDSVGHWEGGTLVIDSIAISADTYIDGPMPHTDALHVVERLSRTGPDTMEDLITIDDPKTFAHSWQFKSLFKREPGIQLGENYCVNDRNPPTKAGASGVTLQGGGR